MSLYRQASGPRTTVVVGVGAIGLVLGLLAGLALGGGGDEEISLREALAQLEARAQPVELALEQVPIEYGGAVRAGKVAAPTEYRASRATVERAVRSYAGVEGDLALLDRRTAGRTGAAIDRVRDLVRRKADPPVVRAASRRASLELERALRP